ncbi:hypothetical protein [Desulfobaculum senezii]
MGWYLRLSRASVIEVLVRKDVLASLEDQRATNDSWRLDAADEGDHVRARFVHTLREKS